MQGKAQQLSDSNRRIMEADAAPPRRVYQAWKGSNVRISCPLFWVCDCAVVLTSGAGNQELRRVFFFFAILKDGAMSGWSRNGV